MYRQGIPDINLFIEQDTDRTPEPKKFYIFHNGQVVSSHPNLKTATKKYKEIKNASGYVPPQRDKTTSEEVARSIQDDLMNRKGIYWAGSTSHRSTNKSRR